MSSRAEFKATPLQFVKDNNTDLVNLILGWVVFWVYGFRTVFTCGYTHIQTVSRFYCDKFIDELAANTECDLSSDTSFNCPEWENIPRFGEPYTKELYATCTGHDGIRFDTYGSLNPRGGFGSGVYGSGEFVVTLMLLLLTTVVFFWKMVKFVKCPDKLERKRRKEEMLKQYLKSKSKKQ
jgi:hypothetical protein